MHGHTQLQAHTLSPSLLALLSEAATSHMRGFCSAPVEDQEKEITSLPLKVQLSHIHMCVGQPKWLWREQQGLSHHQHDETFCSRKFSSEVYPFQCVVQFKEKWKSLSMIQSRLKVTSNRTLHVSGYVSMTRLSTSEKWVKKTLIIRNTLGGLHFVDHQQTPNRMIVPISFFPHATFSQLASELRCRAPAHK